MKSLQFNKKSRSNRNCTPRAAISIATLLKFLVKSLQFDKKSSNNGNCFTSEAIFCQFDVISFKNSFIYSVNKDNTIVQTSNPEQWFLHPLGEHIAFPHPSGFALGMRDAIS